jgi:hypothetical protein
MQSIDFHVTCSKDFNLSVLILKMENEKNKLCNIKKQESNFNLVFIYITYALKNVIKSKIKVKMWVK